MPRKSFFIIVICLAAILDACADSSPGPESTAMLPSRGRMVTGEHLFAIDAFGDTLAWVVGFGGTIFHTPNGGKDWSAQEAPLNEDLYDVCFINPQTGWIVGKHGTILHTRDGGKKWEQQQVKTSERLFDVHFVSDSLGWTVGTMGTILHTADAGNTWVKQGWGEDRYYNGVFFVDAENGWIVGEYATIYSTHNGGESWIAQKCEEIQPQKPDKDFPPPPPNLYGVYFISSAVGWASGMDGVIIKTEDGGQTWKRLTPKADFSLYQLVIVGGKGWVIGGQGSYMVSSEGGATWNHDRDALGTNFWLRALTFTDEHHGWIVGAAGTILKTDDGGNTWKKISGIFYK